YSMAGLPATRRKGLGTSSVSGRRRVPSPPAMTTAFIGEATRAARQEPSRYECRISERLSAGAGASLMRRRALAAPMASKGLRVAAFAAVYVIWGSTYLAIRYAVADLPPFLMASARWLVAGVALYLVRRASGDARPTLREWGAAALVGALLI